MAMRVDNGFALELRRTVVGPVDQKFAQQKGLAFELLRFRIVAQQVGHLVAEDRDTAWLQTDDGRTRCNIRLQGRERLFQCGFGPVKHAEVIEWAPATE